MVRLRQNDAAALKQAIELLRDPKSPLAERLLYARVLGELRPAEAVAPLLALAQSEPQSELRRTALAALGGFDDASIAPAILPSLKTASTEIRGAALTLLLSRTHSITALLEALEKGVVAPSSLPAEAVDRLRKITDQGLRSRAEKLFPKTGEDTDFAARRLKVETALRSGAGNPYEGEPLYQQRCAGCHKLFYKGGGVGPDLTNYQRDNLGTMLVSILNPNAEIREGYAGYEVETKDGRCLTGFVKDRDARAVILRGLDSQDTVLQQGEIVKLEPLGRCLMPEGLLDDLTDQQLRDFLAYLRSSQPFTR